MTYFVKVLSALVKVCRRAEDGSPKMRPVGLHPATGEQLLAPDVRTVTLQKGDPLPDDIADGEVDRLLNLDPPAIGAKAAVSVISAPAKPKAAAKKSSSKRKSATAAKKKTGSSRKAATAPKTPTADLSKLAELDDAGLVTAIAGVGVKKLITAISTDAALAQRVLAAEKTASSGDPRKSLVDPLQKLIAGAAN